MPNPLNRPNSPFRATKTTIHNNWGRFTFILSFNLDIPRFKFMILRLFNILPYISLYFEHKQTHCLCGPPVFPLELKRTSRCDPYWVWFEFKFRSIANYVLSCWVVCGRYIEDITCLRVDMNFIFECTTQYLTSERSERVKFRVEQEKIKFISTSGHAIFC